jgi:signal recognition particle GTPase
MAINHTYVINDKRIEEDLLITDITIQFTGDITEEVSTSVYHFQPQTVEEVEASIENRIVTEKDKLLARQKIEQIITEL